MPILQHILRGDRVWAADPDVEHDVHGGVKRSVYFDIQVAADIVAERGDRGLDVAEDSIGPKKMPYPEMFVEWDTLGLRWGCYLAERIDDDGQPCFTMRVINDDAYAHHLSMVVYTDSAGRFLDWAIGSDNEDIEPTEEDVENTKGLTASVIMALGLINCRNVTTKETGRVTARRSGAQKRRGEKSREIRYNTIVLPGGGTESDGHGGARATALHRVRGHFKTFTADRPLMGKHVGTYWWGWQVRGSAEHGTVVSDYQLGGPGETGKPPV
jgi:hypothetical protein